MKLSGLSLKITLPVLVITSFAIAFNGYLNYAKFQKHLVQVEMSRMKYSVDDIRANLETGLRLGLPVQAITNAQEIISFAAGKDSSILSVEVLDHGGKGLFRTGQDSSLHAALPNWRSSVIKKQKTLEILAPDSFLIIVPLIGITEDFSGALAVRYSREMHDAMMREVFTALAPANLFAILVSIFIGALGVHLLVRRCLEEIGTVERALETAGTSADMSAISGTDETVLSAGVAAKRAIDSIRKAKESLVQA